MYYKLKDDIALRSWQFVPRAYYVRNDPYAKNLTEEEFNVLIKCNGRCDITPDSIVSNFEQRGLIEKCYPGAKTSEWSQHKSYSHRYFPKMNFMITGKCNYNCLHCFNAADNSPIMTEWKYSDILQLLDQARDCGIHAFTITGGEPMMHPKFLDIISEIHKRNMFVEEINSNGYFITKQMLDEFKKIGCKPLIKISFDGFGYHDWMRNHKGAEDKTVNVIKTCIRNGFTIMVQTQVHRKDFHTLIPTAQMLSAIGVKTMHLIRTTEVAHWQKNSPDRCLPIEKYYQNMLDFVQEYKNSRMNTQIIVWQFIRLDPMSHSYKLDAVLCPSGNFNIHHLEKF